MSTSAGPNIVEDGLVLSIDPANQKSYSPNMVTSPLNTTSYISGSAACTISQDITEKSPVGGISMRMTTTANDARAAGSGISITNGETWTVSVWVKANRQITSTGQLYLLIYNSTGGLLSAPATSISFNQNWQKITTTTTISNSSAVTLQVRFDGPDTFTSGDIIWWDGAQLEKSSSATPFNPNYYGNIINDLSGNGNNGTIFGDFTFNGNTKVLHSNGVTGSYIDIPSPNLTSSDFTVISATRYAGASPRGRIISAKSNNWLMGHWGGNANKYYSAGWVSTYTQADEEWRIFAGTGNISSDQYSFFSNKNKLVTNSAGGSAGPNGFSIGRYGTGNSEYSNCDVGFLAVYNRVLSDSEIQQIFNALRSRYGI
jgi:hypothetical protein